MPFQYRLQKILEIRIRKKEEQLQQVIKAQEEVNRIELLIIKNEEEIKNLSQQMHQADPMMYEQYDKFIKHLWEENKKLQLEKQEAINQLEKEKELLVKHEQEVSVLENHKEKKREQYKEEEKAFHEAAEKATESIKEEFEATKTSIKEKIIAIIKFLFKELGNS